MSDRERDTVVIGVGNAWRRDDGVGLEVVRRARASLPPWVAVVELDGEPARVVEAWDGAALAVLVDAVRTGAPPGTRHRLDPSAAAKARGPAGTTHALGPGEAYRLGRALGRLPATLVVLGIEVADVGTGPGLSDAVAAAVDDAAGEVVAVVTNAPVGSA